MDFSDILQNIAWAEILKDTAVILLKLIGIFIAFAIVKGIGSRLIDSAFDRVQKRDNLSAARAKTLTSLSKNIFSYTLIFIFIVMIFEIFNYDVKALLAGAGIIGLAVGFGAQGLVSDIVTGFFLLLEKQLDVEEYVTMAGYSGIVESVGLRTTQVRAFDGTLIYIPNREISSLSNHSRGNMRALVDMSISYGDNIDEATAILQSACDQFAAENEAVKEGPNVIGVQSLGASDVVIRVIAKTENGAQWEVERQLRKILKETLDQNGIEIPYPHQVYINKKQEN
ncbi:mechanosensitive ion channel family protein [Bacillus marinisedimentorum]|uniref:mechanosensitive ion channel family protein n=1 Tax=Bacillus marinisedimentorum TaxID=1821260 RepID=UPI0007E198D3|nr:mechanosensitive ion channel family protein [Bacillus marinisedimentorum]